jgi:hypothetical protein
VSAQDAEYVPVNGWHFQVAIWGYSIQGDVLEQDALMAEYEDSYPLWDRTRRDLASSAIDRGNGWEPVPDWYALHHLPMPVRARTYAAHIDGKVSPEGRTQ